MKHIGSQIKIYEEEITAGKGLGRKIGYPTLNLLGKSLEEKEDGIYAVLFLSEKGEEIGALFIGRSSNDKKRTFELHLIKKNLEKTPKIAKIKVIKKVSEVDRVTSLKKLKEKIRNDIKAIKDVFKPKE